MNSLPQPVPPESKKSSPCRVKLQMPVKTIQLICNALKMTSFRMIQASAERYF